jgi:hypothetical protein
VPEGTVQPPGLEFRLGLDANGQKYARWPAAKSDSVVYDDAEADDA